MKKTFQFLTSVLIPLIVGFGGSFFTTSAINAWYTTINKPSFNPPNWIFAPVWTMLFILIGISFYLVWRENFGKEKGKVIGIYSLQLGLNFLWSILFFGIEKPLFALIEIFILWLAIIANIAIFWKVSKPAAYLLIPYLLWVSFASILNMAIVVLN